MPGTTIRRKLKKTTKQLRTDLRIRRLHRLFYQAHGGITVPLRHGVGNKLLQYSIGRILAERTGLTMSIGFHKSKHETELDDPLGELLSTFELDLYVPGSTIAGVPRILRSDTCPDVMKVQGDRPLVVYGQFFRYEYLKPYKSKIRNDWLPLKVEELPSVSENAACVHMRFGDLIQLGKNLNVEYYMRAVETMKWDQLTILTDDPSNSIAKEISSAYGGTIVSNPRWRDDFKIMAAHKQIAICESTFSWWAAWLSDAELIVSPGPKLDIARYGGYWPIGLGKNNPYVDDETRYIFLN